MQTSGIELNNQASKFYDTSYQTLGFGAQRRYPNEELCRFMGRNFFSLPPAERKNIKILELGCGSGANIWMIAKEGFDAHGVDFSPTALNLAREMLNSYGQSAFFKVADMTALPYGENEFDCVIDVFSANCMNKKEFTKVLGETRRVLKPNGKFFTYTPGKKSEAWKNFHPATRIDDSTLDGISRTDSPYYSSPYPFRFSDQDELRMDCMKSGLTITYLESVTRTYKTGGEMFEFIVAEAVKD